MDWKRLILVRNETKIFLPDKGLSNSDWEGCRLLLIERLHRGSGIILKVPFWGHPVFGSGELSEQTWAWTAWCSCRPGSARRSWSPRPRRSPSRTPRHTAGQHRCLASWKGSCVPGQAVTRPGVEPTACFELPAVLVVAHGIATQSVVQASPTLRTCVRACANVRCVLKVFCCSLWQLARRILPNLPRSLWSSQTGCAPAYCASQLRTLNLFVYSQV